MNISADKVFSGSDWISACQFHELSDQQVLEEMLTRVAQCDNPVVLLDLDSTLYEVAPRTLQILLEWAHEEKTNDFGWVKEKVVSLTLGQIKYSVRDTLEALPLQGDVQLLQSAIDSAQKYWFKRFFTDEYLVHDLPYPGSPEFVRELHQNGAQIVYLTGRDEPNMGKGTRSNLLRDDFPWEVERTHLFLKRDFHDLDLDHKKLSVENIKKIGRLIASLENEPPNLVALSELLPESMHVFVDTVCSNHGAAPKRGLYRLKSFCSKNALG